MTITTLFDELFILKRSNNRQSVATVFFVAKSNPIQRWLMMYMYHFRFFKLYGSFSKNKIVPLLLLTDGPLSFSVNESCPALTKL